MVLVEFLLKIVNRDVFDIFDILQEEDVNVEKILKVFENKDV
jgi:hypothetical protein